MTVGELVDYIRSLAPQAMAAPTGQLVNLLSIAQEEVSREAKLPRKVVQYDDLTAANQLVLPTDARKESLVAAYVIAKDDTDAIVSSRELPIYDFVTASRRYSDWTLWDPSDGTRFIMYDPAYDPDCPRPAPAPSADYPTSFRVIYVVKPTAFAGLDSTVFDGKFKGLAPVIAYRVLYLLTKDTMMLREYERAAYALSGQARPAPVVVKNALYLDQEPWGVRG